jgi:adenylate kinase
MGTKLVIYYVLEVRVLIFIGGVHGVGKSTFCRKVKESLGLETYSASTLIAESKKVEFPSDKLIPDIDENQLYLLAAIELLRLRHKTFLLDGHFCLNDAEGRVARIPKETFEALAPRAIILLTEATDVLSDRRRERDGVECSEVAIQGFQNEETAYATEVAEALQIPLKICQGTKNYNETIAFISEIAGR